MKKKYSLKNIISYIQGNIRYRLYYSLKFYDIGLTHLIPKHIKEQIDIRINSMDKECYNKGECKMCGCKTTALQMANKACGKPCYPKMLKAKEWRLVSRCRNTIYCEETNLFWKLDLNKDKFVIDYVGK